MEILIFGDVHGREDWIKIVELYDISKLDKIIFVGDYVDSYIHRPVEIIHNLKKIIDFKLAHLDKVELLLGNHDWAYIHDMSGIKGFNWHARIDYKAIFEEHKNLFKIAWGYTNLNTQKYTLVTHAGLTLTYYNNYILNPTKDDTSILYKLTNGDISKYEIHELLNFMINHEIIYKIGAGRRGMGTPGPLWADYNELIKDPYPNINQVFGHTAPGTVKLFQIDDNFLIKVDNNRKQIATITLDI